MNCGCSAPLPIIIESAPSGSSRTSLSLLAGLKKVAPSRKKETLIKLPGRPTKAGIEPVPGGQGLKVAGLQPSGGHGLCPGSQPPADSTGAPGGRPMRSRRGCDAHCFKSDASQNCFFGCSVMGCGASTNSRRIQDEPRSIESIHTVRPEQSADQDQGNF